MVLLANTKTPSNSLQKIIVKHFNTRVNVYIQEFTYLIQSFLNRNSRLCILE